MLDISTGKDVCYETEYFTFSDMDDGALSFDAVRLFGGGDG